MEWNWNGNGTELSQQKKIYARKEWKWNGNGMLMEWKINGQP